MLSNTPLIIFDNDEDVRCVCDWRTVDSDVPNLNSFKAERPTLLFNVFGIDGFSIRQTLCPLKQCMNSWAVTQFEQRKLAHSKHFATASDCLLLHAVQRGTVEPFAKLMLTRFLEIIPLHCTLFSLSELFSSMLWIVERPGTAPQLKPLLEDVDEADDETHDV